MNELGVTAYAVSSLAEHSRKEAVVEVPAGVAKIETTGEELVVTMHDGNVYEKKFPFVILGEISVEPGVYYIPVVSVGDNIVKVGTGPFISYISPTCVNMNDLPAVVTMKGYDLDKVTHLYLQSPSGSGGSTADYPLNLVTFHDPETLFIQIMSNQVFANPQGDPFYFYIADATAQTSAKVLFNVQPGNSC